MLRLFFTTLAWNFACFSYMEQLEFITYILMGILFTQRSCLLFAISVLVPFHGINNASSKIALIYEKKRPLCCVWFFLIALIFAACGSKRWNHAAGVM